MTMIIPIMAIVLVVMAPAIIGAVLRLFLRDVSPLYLSTNIGIVFTLIQSVLYSPNHSLASLALSFQAQNIPDRMVNLIVTGSVLFYVFIFSSIAAFGIRKIDQRK